MWQGSLAARPRGLPYEVAPASKLASGLWLCNVSVGPAIDYGTIESSALGGAV